MKFVYFNNTCREVSIQSANEHQDTKCDMSTIQPLAERVFILLGNYLSLGENVGLRNRTWSKYSSFRSKGK